MIRHTKRWLCLLAGIGALTLPGDEIYASAADVKMTLALNQPSYVLDDSTTPDPIQATITIENSGADDVITSAGFSDQPFHLQLLIFDPGGKAIIADEVKNKVEGDPPMPNILFDENATPVQVQAVEVLAGTATGGLFRLEVQIPNVRTFYSFVSSGHYRVKVSVPFRTYSEIFKEVNGAAFTRLGAAVTQGTLESNIVDFALVGDVDQDAFVFPGPDCNDNDPNVNPGTPEIPGNNIDDDCNPATTDIITIAPGTILVEAKQLTVGRKKHRYKNVEAIVALPLRAFERSGACVQRVSFAPGRLRAIWLSCVPATIGQTDSGGTAILNVPPGDYIVIGEYPPGTPFGDPDDIYPARFAHNVESGDTKRRVLLVVVNEKKEDKAEKDKDKK